MSLSTQSTGNSEPLLAVPRPRLHRNEPWNDRLRRWVLGVAWSLKPPRTLGVPAVLAMTAAHYLGFTDRDERLPDPSTALKHPNGLAGICGDLSVPTLLEAYAKGLFPLAHVGPLKWWAPDPRMVLFLEDFSMEKNLRRRLRNKHFNVTFDRVFEDVMRGCAEPRPGRAHLTWITPEVMDIYAELFEAGHAHSVEVWDQDGHLAGGVYGVSVGRVFFTESQFVRKRDASKVGFATLNRHLQHWGYVLNDGKHPTAHLTHVGFGPVSRNVFSAVLAEHACAPGKAGRWAADDLLDVGNWDPKAAAESAKPAGQAI